jgi:hypothetical protein
VTLPELIERGRESLVLWGIEVKALSKNASLDDEYWKRLVASRYRGMGYDVQQEVSIRDSKSVDLVATKRDERIAIEIETGKSNVRGNASKSTESGVDEVAVIYTRGTTRGLWAIDMTEATPERRPTEAWSSR